MTFKMHLHCLKTHKQNNDKGKKKKVCKRTWPTTNRSQTTFNSKNKEKLKNRFIASK